VKFLLVSNHGDFAGGALRLQEEGNDVRLLIQEEQARDTLRGLIPTVKSLPEGLRFTPDVVLFDMVRNGSLADRLRKTGQTVLGASAFQDKIELDRMFGMDLAKRQGIKVPEYTKFGRMQWKQAAEFAKKSKKEYVLKPLGNANVELTYVSKSPEDMAQFLEWASTTGKIEQDFILQEKIDGIELSTEVWFSGGSPVFPPNGTMEEKKFMAGGVGPNTGCQGSIVWPYPVSEPRIVQQTLKKLYPGLHAVGYSGCLDINTIVAEDGKAYFLEFTARFGYSAIYALAEILNDDLGKIIYDCAKGTLKKMDVRNEFGMAIRCSIPPYPLESHSEGHAPVVRESRDKPLRNVPLGHSWLLDVKKDEGRDELLTAGIDGAILEVTSNGSTIDDAEKRLYERVKQIDLPDMQYRNDIGDRAEEELPKLRAMGFSEMPDPEGRHGRKNANDHPVPNMSKERETAVSV
jgi:phosphoribosylamine---glycine ligase